MPNSTHIRTFMNLSFVSIHTHTVRWVNMANQWDSFLLVSNANKQQDCNAFTSDSNLLILFKKLSEMNVYYSAKYM